MKVDYFAFTDVGLKRNINQDSYAVECNPQAGLYLFAVADGMGGHSHGERASRTIITKLIEWSKEMPLQKDADAPAVAEALKMTILRANREIREGSAENEICGSTLVVLCAWKEAYIVISIGDSRIYRYGGSGFTQITRDDVWEMQQSVMEKYTPEEILRHPEYGKLVSAVGVFPDPPISYNIDVLDKKMNFLLCSDGIYKYCEESDVKRCVSPYSLESGENRLRRIKKKVFANGAGDNVTAILVTFKP